MKVRMKTLYCTAEAVCDPGKVIDVPDNEAKALIAGGYAADPSVGPVQKVKKALSAAMGRRTAESDE